MSSFNQIATFPATLVALRDALLPKPLSGELRVPTNKPFN